MLKKILLALLFVIVVAVVIGFMLPQKFDVSRSVNIRAEPAKVHALVGDLKEWPRWAPWQENDPSLKTTFGDKTTGVGASQTWTSEGGDGRLSFTQCDPATGIAYDMVFVNGTKETPASGRMRYTPVTGGVEVIWSMDGDMNMAVVGGYMAMFSDRMIGPMFERGLEKLKVEAEKP